VNGSHAPWGHVVNELNGTPLRPATAEEWLRAARAAEGRRAPCERASWPDRRSPWTVTVDGGPAMSVSLADIAAYAEGLEHAPPAAPRAEQARRDAAVALGAPGRLGKRRHADAYRRVRLEILMARAAAAGLLDLPGRAAGPQRIAR
jgi:hypothetical protein